MASSRTSIGNESLALIRAANGFNNIDTSDEPNAKVARMFLDEHTEELMSEYDWNAFSRVAPLENITDEQAPPSDWLYRYSWPVDCLVPRMVLVAGYARNQTPIPFRMELLPDGSATSVLTDQDVAELRYTSNEFAPLVQNWPSNFRRAVTYRLASSLATAVKEDGRKAELMHAMYMDSMRMARYIDSSSGIIGESQDPAGVRARRGGSRSNIQRSPGGGYQYLGEV